jgi:hypothetical protein
VRKRGAPKAARGLMLLVSATCPVSSGRRSATELSQLENVTWITLEICQF